MAKRYPAIKVFITRKLKFRAEIQESCKTCPYEVTVNGEQWNKGKGEKYHDDILKICNRILETLKDNLR